MKYFALRILCNLQNLLGFLLIAAAAVFLVVRIQEEAQRNTAIQLIDWAIAGGLAFLGVQVIAVAQVFECLMQIEINTRKADTV